MPSAASCGSRRCAERDPRQRLDQRRGAQVRQAIGERAGGVIGSLMAVVALLPDRTGVEAGFHAA